MQLVCQLKIFCNCKKNIVVTKILFFRLIIKMIKIVNQSYQICKKIINQVQGSWLNYTTIFFQEPPTISPS
jgi:hypothetical protein